MVRYESVDVYKRIEIYKKMISDLQADLSSTHMLAVEYKARAELAEQENDNLLAQLQKHEKPGGHVQQLKEAASK